jgi:hypothetical protein
MSEYERTNGASAVAAMRQRCQNSETTAPFPFLAQTPSAAASHLHCNDCLRSSLWRRIAGNALHFRPATRPPTGAAFECCRRHQDGGDGRRSLASRLAASGGWSTAQGFPLLAATGNLVAFHNGRIVHVIWRVSQLGGGCVKSVVP